MRKNRSLDALVKARLREWPQHPPGLKLRTLPDGLWLNFGGTPEEPFVDIFGII